MKKEELTVPLQVVPRAWCQQAQFLGGNGLSSSLNWGMENKETSSPPEALGPSDMFSL